MVYVIQVCWQLTTGCTDFSNLFLEQNSTCFGQLLCPSSGVFHCTHNNGICHTSLLTACIWMHWFLKFIFGIKLYMFRTAPLSIIRSFSLYTQQWYMSYRFTDSLQLDSLISQIYFWNKTLHVSGSSTNHHQQFFTVGLLASVTDRSWPRFVS